jgi:uncharacterized protein (TIGR00369 family)
MPLAEDIQGRLTPLFPGLMGIKITHASQDKVIASMLVRSDLCTGGGVCHGGALMALADTLGAVGTVINLPPNTRTTTIESKTNFLAAAALDTEVTAESVPLHRGRTTQVWQTTITSAAGKVCAIVLQTQMVLPN